MRYLLDTNILIYIARRKPPAVESRLARLRPGDVAMSIVSYLELVYGAQRSQRPKENLERVEQLEQLIPALPLDRMVATHFGRIRAELERKGSPIGSYDLLIASHALALGLTLVTNNTREFGRVEGLHLENWAATP